MRAIYNIYGGYDATMRVLIEEGHADVNIQDNVSHIAVDRCPSFSTVLVCRSMCLCLSKSSSYYDESARGVACTRLLWLFLSSVECAPHCVRVVDGTG